uniref:(northern house mosquito) hypothetical protein n=1 Tax=Culex pipiens TaxID=7175 RepID=A0A8D8BP04_CULPI
MSYFCCKSECAIVIGGRRRSPEEEYRSVASSQRSTRTKRRKRKKNTTARKKLRSGVQRKLVDKVENNFRSVGTRRRSPDWTGATERRLAETQTATTKEHGAQTVDPAAAEATVRRAVQRSLSKLYRIYVQQRRNYIFSCTLHDCWRVHVHRDRR